MSKIKKYRDDNRAIDSLFCNMKNSQWAKQKLDEDEIGDGWAYNYFEYPEREILKRPYSSESMMCKQIDLPGSALQDFIESLHNIGIERLIMLEVFDCDSRSMKADSALRLYLKIDDFETFIKPQLTEKPDVDYHDITGANDPDRIILLDDKPIKQSELKQYWEIVGADTDEKRMWNVPTYEQLIKTLEPNQD